MGYTNPSTSVRNSVITALADLKLQHPLTHRFDADPCADEGPRQVQELFSWCQPTPAPEPVLLCHSEDMAKTLELSPECISSEDFLGAFSGSQPTSNMKPHATSYGGYQFGQWAGQLGDGRAINLGDVLTGTGQTWALQLKGAGPTPYSRHADGFAVLRSSIREFLCSEAMHHLRIPTTRALSLITTGRPIVRDMFYDGNPKAEPGAVVCRVAPSFIRFGHFDLQHARKNTPLLKQLIEFAMDSDILTWKDHSEESVLAWFDSICQRTLDMVIHWQRVGFVHGVLNTDNLSIQGLTIDYGPYGWLEDFDLGWTPNTTDAQGKRYSYGHQPTMCYWNLQRLAEAIGSALEAPGQLKISLEQYKTDFAVKWRAMMLGKMGLESASDGSKDDPWIQSTLSLLSQTETDMTIFFRQLAKVQSDQTMEVNIALLQRALYQTPAPDHLILLRDWISTYLKKVSASGLSDQERAEKMNLVNPKYVLRNYLAQVAIDRAEQGDPSEIKNLLDVLQSPYDEQPANEAYAEKRPEWARHRAGCSMLSCSS